MNAPTRLAVVLLAGCGAATPASGIRSANPAGDCEAARIEAHEAWARVAEDARALATATPPESPLMDAIDAARTHIASLEATPRGITGAEAMRLSSAMMDAIDEEGRDAPRDVRRAADDAAERVLMERGPDDAGAAARGALSALEELLHATRPSAAEASLLREQAHAIAPLAAAAASAYRAAEVTADSLAAEAENSPLSGGEVARLRAEASGASERARGACGTTRSVTLSAPR